MKGVLAFLLFGLSSSSDARPTLSVFCFCSSVWSLGYPLSVNLLSSLFIASDASSGEVQIFLMRRNWPYGIFDFCFGGGMKHGGGRRFYLLVWRTRLSLGCHAGQGGCSYPDSSRSFWSGDTQIL